MTGHNTIEKINIFLIGSIKKKKRLNAMNFGEGTHFDDAVIKRCKRPDKIFCSLSSAYLMRDKVVYNSFPFNFMDRIAVKDR